MFSCSSGAAESDWPYTVNLACEANTPAVGSIYDAGDVNSDKKNTQDLFSFYLEENTQCLLGDKRLLSLLNEWTKCGQTDNKDGLSHVLTRFTPKPRN